MKILVIHLVLLFVICIVLPFLFNVKYSESMAPYPSDTDIVRGKKTCTDSSFIDSSFIEGMTNQTNLSAYSSYSLYNVVKPPPKEDESFFNSIFKGIFNITMEPYEDRKFTNTNHNNTQVIIKEDEKIVNNKGELVIQNIDTNKDLEALNDLEWNLQNVKNEYQIFIMKNPGAKWTPSSTGTATTTGATGTATTTDATETPTTTTVSSGTSPPTAPSNTTVTTSPPSTLTGVTLGNKEYTYYDSYIDAELIKQPGNSASEYLRNRDVVNSESGAPNITPSSDEFINNINSEISIISFFMRLFDKNKDREAYQNHDLKDAKDHKTYTLEPKEKLVYYKGKLKEKMVDDTQYGDLVKLFTANLRTLNDQFDKLRYNTSGSDETSTGTSTGTSRSTTTSTSSTNEPRGVSSNRNRSFEDYEDVPDASCNTMKIKCVADFGTEIGDDLCCGQEGELESTKFVCPNTLPTCSNYKCGSHFGTCS